MPPDTDDLEFMVEINYNFIAFALSYISFVNKTDPERGSRMLRKLKDTYAGLFDENRGVNNAPIPKG